MNERRRGRWSQVMVLTVLGLCAGPARSAAPAGRYVTDTDTVLDTTNNLRWQRASAPTTTRTWSASDTYCRTLNLGGFSTGWRLPTIKELHTLVDIKTYNPALDPVFPAPGSNYYWSSTLQANASSSAWILSFSNGGQQGTAPLTQPYLVRCVR